MKIVDLKTFRKLPSNTLFSKYEPYVFDSLEIKGDTLEHDFLTQSIHSSIDCLGSEEFVEKLDQAQETGESLEMDFDCQGRDGCFEKDQLFAIWEPDDVIDLIDQLKKCVHLPYAKQIP